MIDHQTVLIFIKESLDSDKPILVVILPPLKFAGGTSNQGIKGNMHGALYPDISVAVVIAVGVTMYK